MSQPMTLTEINERLDVLTEGRRIAAIWFGHGPQGEAFFYRIRELLTLQRGYTHGLPRDDPQLPAVPWGPLLKMSPDLPDGQIMLYYSDGTSHIREIVQI